MPVPDFSPGEVLTAAAMDSIGLWKITQGTLSSSATSFVDCFSSTYRDYRIVLDDLSINATTDFCWQGLIGVTAQTSSLYWVAANGFSAGGSAYNTNGANQNPGRTTASINGANTKGTLVMDIFRPNLASQTMFTAQFSSFQADDFRVRSGGGGYNNSALLTGIRFLSAGGQTISGNVTIYGYRD
jgi:hypothetical protein